MVLVSVFLFGKVYARNSDRCLLSLPENHLSKNDSFSIMRFMETLDRYDLAILSELQTMGASATPNSPPVWA